MSGISGIGLLKGGEASNVLDTREKRFFNKILDGQVFRPETSQTSQSQSVGDDVLNISEKRYFNKLLDHQLFGPADNAASSETFLNRNEKQYFNAMLDNQVFTLETQAATPSSIGEDVLDSSEKRFFNNLLHDEVFSGNVNKQKVEESYASNDAARGARLNVKL